MIDYKLSSKYLKQKKNLLGPISVIILIYNYDIYIANRPKLWVSVRFVHDIYT